MWKYILIEKIISLEKYSTAERLQINKIQKPATLETLCIYISLKFYKSCLQEWWFWLVSKVSLEFWYVSNLLLCPIINWCSYEVWLSFS